MVLRSSGEDAAGQVGGSAEGQDGRALPVLLRIFSDAALVVRLSLFYVLKRSKASCDFVRLSCGTKTFRRR